MPLILFARDDDWFHVRGLDRPMSLAVRVSPDDAGRHRVRELRLNATDDQQQPITAADLRDLPLARVEAMINASPTAPGDTVTDHDPIASGFTLRSGGPQDGLTDAFLRDVARAYAAAIARGQSPNVAMAGQTGYPVRSVQRWVYTARQRGLMPRGSKGRLG